MRAAKWMLLGSVTLFSAIGVMALLKNRGSKNSQVVENKAPVISAPAIQPASPPSIVGGAPPLMRPAYTSKGDFPAIDRIFQLFDTRGSTLPIVETLTYSSAVSWLKGRPAWLADYAAHYKTSRHFIARSLNGRPDYEAQQVREQSRFNVFRTDKRIEFHLLVDVSRCKMGFYYVDLDTNERVLLKTYSIGLGKIDASKPSGTLTPLGRYKLGSQVAIYQRGMMGLYKEHKVEMVSVFGTRWMPLESLNGYGFQGAPWRLDERTGELIEYKEGIGAYDSDGCVRLSSSDIEELFAIVLTKPTWVEIVKDFQKAALPGIEVATPSR